MNKNKQILFLHGWSSDGGTKTMFLRGAGYDVTTPALSDLCFWRAVSQARSAYDDLQPDVLVGSSRGAAVAMNLDAKHTPMVLLAPAWKSWGKATSIKNAASCIIIHSPKDDLVPFSDTLELSQNSPGVAVIPGGIDHRLNCVCSSSYESSTTNSLRSSRGRHNFIQTTPMRQSH